MRRAAFQAVSLELHDHLDLDGRTLGQAADGHRGPRVLASVTVEFAEEFRGAVDDGRAVGAGASHRHRQRNEAAFAHAAQHLAALVEQAGDAGAVDLGEIVLRAALAFGRED